MKAHLTTHAILDTIPLRIGVVLSDRKVLLENLVLDQIGTDQQNQRELNEKRYHVIANLVALYPNRKDLGRWRLVIKDSLDSQKLPPVFTILPIDSDIRTEANLTKALFDARQRGDMRITPEYICDVLHPLYLAGQLRNQQDLSDLINKEAVEGLVTALEEANADRKTLLNRITELEAKEAVQDQEMSKVNYENQVIEVTDSAILLDALVVSIERQKGPTQYTQIELSNGLKLLKKWDIPKTLAKAVALKGKKVRTTVWNRVGSKPSDRDYWESTKWFEDIYEIKDSSKEASE
jgi:hypothetical protein